MGKRVGLALLVLAGMFSCACGAAMRGASRQVMAARNSQLFYQGRHGPLSKAEQEWAQIAWKYFEHNTNPQTGLVNGVQGEPRTTMWETADYLAALLAAERMKLINDKQFHDRVTSLIGTLNSFPLAGGFLPNKYYNTENGQPVNEQGANGLVGWSAIDIGRLLLWLRILREERPEFSEYVDRIVMRWDPCQMVDASGNLMGGTYSNDVLQVQQQGRLGYEEYAAQGFKAWGFDTSRASQLEPFEKVKVYNLELLYDGRDERRTSALAPIVSTPYLLWGLELNWTDSNGGRSISREGAPSIKDLAHRVYLVQEIRYKRDKIFTARTDHRIGHPPFRVVDAVFVKGYPWNTVTESGEEFPADAIVATQAVFPMRALWKTPYTERLTRIARNLYEAEKGWYEGRYENTGSAERTFSLTANAMVLESLCYQLEGRLYRYDAKVGLYDIWKRNPYRPNAVCTKVESK